LSIAKCELMELGSTIISLLILSLFYCLNLLCVYATSYREVLVVGQLVRNSDTLVSKGGNYELGFFTRKIENSTKYYVGIWSKKVANDKIVWVANRDDNAFQTSSVFLTIDHDGNIVIIDGDMMSYVTGAPNSTNNRISNSTYATLLDTGNLVLLNNSTKVILWQSFDNPTDTLLPGMNIGYHTDTGHTWSLRSWKSKDDPSSGPYTLRYDSRSANLSVSKGSNVLWIDGNFNFSFHDVLNRAEFKQSYGLNYTTIPIDSNSRFILEASGDLKYQAWSEESKKWIFLQSSTCATNNSCGFFSICNPQTSDPCQCLSGFKQSNAGGCVRIKKLSCNNNNIKDGHFSSFNMSVKSLQRHHVYWPVDTPAQCNYTCFNDCSCVAYAYDFFDGTCIWWKDQVPTLTITSTEDSYKNIDNYNLTFHLRVAGSDRRNPSKLKELIFFSRKICK